MFKKIFFLALLPFALMAEELPEERVLRQFVFSVLTKNEAGIKNNSIFNHKNKILWQGSKPSPAEAARIAHEVKEVKIEWKKVDETLRIQGSDIVITENMVSDTRKIAIFKHVDIKVPLLLIKLKNGEWRVNSLWLIISKGKEAARKESEAIADYRVTIDGKVYQMNLDEKNKLTLANGQEISILLEQNANLHFRKGGLDLYYPKEMKVTDYVKPSSTLVQFSSDLSVFAQIEVSPKPADTRKTAARFANAYRENFIKQKARFEKGGVRETEYTIAGKSYPALEMNVNVEGKIVRNTFVSINLKGRNVMVYLRTSQEDYVAAQNFFGRLLKRLSLY